MAEVDSLEIEVSAAADAAIKKINALAGAIEHLRGITSRNPLSSLSQKIRGFGNSAEDTTKTVKKQRILDQAGQTVQSNPKYQAIKSASGQVNATKFAKGLERLDVQLDKTDSKISSLKERFNELVNLEDVTPG